MVEKFKEILTEMIKQKGSVSMFALIKMDELVDRWTVVLSASWANSDNRNEVFRYVMDLLIKNLSQEESSTIARIGIFQKEEHIIQLLLKYHKGNYIKGETLNGFMVHEAHILESSPTV